MCVMCCVDVFVFCCFFGVCKWLITWVGLCAMTSRCLWVENKAAHILIWSRAHQCVPSLSSPLIRVTSLVEIKHRSRKTFRNYIPILYKLGSWEMKNHNFMNNTICSKISLFITIEIFPASCPTCTSSSVFDYYVATALKAGAAQCCLSPLYV